MARPVRSVVQLFEELTFEEQKEVLKYLQAAHDLSRSVKRAELEKQLAELGYGAPTNADTGEGTQEGQWPRSGKPDTDS